MDEEKKEELNIFAAAEAILFSVGEPVTVTKLAAILDRSEHEITAALDEGKDRYTGGIELVKLGNAYQLISKEEYGDFVREALGIKKNGAISKSSLEALAIIAYNQPTTKAYVEKVRGVDSSYAFGFLMSRELIEQCGRLDAPGRPILYKTTPDFLRVFGLNSLDDLPVTDNEEQGLEQITIDSTPDAAVNESDNKDSIKEPAASDEVSAEENINIPDNGESSNEKPSDAEPDNNETEVITDTNEADENVEVTGEN